MIRNGVLPCAGYSVAKKFACTDFLVRCSTTSDGQRSALPVLRQRLPVFAEAWVIGRTAGTRFQGQSPPPRARCGLSWITKDMLYPVRNSLEQSSTLPKRVRVLMHTVGVSSQMQLHYSYVPATNARLGHPKSPMKQNLAIYCDVESRVLKRPWVMVTCDVTRTGPW